MWYFDIAFFVLGLNRFVGGMIATFVICELMKEVASLINGERSEEANFSVGLAHAYSPPYFGFVPDPLGLLLT